MTRILLPADRRVFGRRESCIRAVVYIAGRPPLHCIVRNYSQGGALLELAEPVDVTGHARLVIESQGVDVNCEVRHHNGTGMGVRFLTAVEVDSLAAAATGAQAPPEPMRPVTGAELRRILFGGPKPDEPIIVRKFSSYSSGFSRYS